MLGVDFAKAFGLAAQLRHEAEFSKTLAKSGDYYMATTVADTIIKAWTPVDSIAEYCVRKILVGDLLREASQNLQSWKYRVENSERFLSKANKIINNESGRVKVGALSLAVTYYTKSYQYCPIPEIQLAKEKCENLLKWHKTFENFCLTGTSLEKQKYYKRALEYYQAAFKIFNNPSVLSGIKSLEKKISEEDKMEDILNEAKYLFNDGRLNDCIRRLEEAVSKFNRSDILYLLSEIKKIKQGILSLENGLNSEKTQSYIDSIQQYKIARDYLPDCPEILFRLAIAYIKSENWYEASLLLNDVSGERASYLRGFVYAKQKQWKDANRQWQQIDNVLAQEQRQFLGTLVKRERMEIMQQIEYSVQNDALDIALTLSYDFIEKFGNLYPVEENLKKHLLPLVNHRLWSEKNWKKILENTRQQWLQEYTIISLHNWAIAAYYCSQENSEFLSEFIIAWSNSVANFGKDPSLRDLGWVDNKDIDFQGLKSNLEQIIDQKLDSLRSDDDAYLAYRDLYRVELVSLRLMSSYNHPVQVNNLIVTPGLCRQYLDKQGSDLTGQMPPVIAALYSEWGFAVAACLSSDIERAIFLKNQTNAQNNDHSFAGKFVAYHEGMYHLQKYEWMQAVSPLKLARTEILNSTEWFEQIDNLCKNQRNNLVSLEENLQFSEFWYKLLDSQSSRSYFAEYQAEKIRESLANEKISDDDATRQLEKLKSIDDNNPVVLDLIERVDFRQKAKSIGVLLNQGKLEEAFKSAKNSNNSQVSRWLSDIFVKFFLDAFPKRELSLEDVCRLGQWAYELSYEDPGLQDIYKLSKQFEVIFNLMKQQRLDEAVRQAKYSGNDVMKSYLADLFMLNLVEQTKNGSFDHRSVLQLAQWAYELCPNDPQFQQIYKELGIRSY